MSNGASKKPRAHHGKHRKRKRGAHKGAGSPETVIWEQEHMVPERPPWMDIETYVALCRVREET
jgi:hypothetical protein